MDQLQLEEELKTLRRGIRAVWVALLIVSLGIGALDLFLLHLIPFAREIYDQIFGPEYLSGLTRFVFEHADSVLIMVGGLMIIPVGLVILPKTKDYLKIYGNLTCSALLILIGLTIFLNLALTFVKMKFW